jgi:hypothetical protein
MALLSFKDWRASLGEASSSTRQRLGWAMGLYPPNAGVMSRSTPSPFIMDKAEKEFGTPKKKHKKKKKKED